MYFVFVVRSGIFENFFLGFVGRQALLTLPLRLVCVVGGKGKCACRRWIYWKCLSAVQEVVSDCQAGVSFLQVKVSTLQVLVSTLQVKVSNCQVRVSTL